MSSGHDKPVGDGWARLLGESIAHRGSAGPRGSIQEFARANARDQFFVDALESEATTGLLAIAGELGGRATAEAVARRLERGGPWSDERARFEALRALGVIGGPSSVVSLARAARTGASAERRDALDMLIRLASAGNEDVESGGPLPESASALAWWKEHRETLKKTELGEAVALVEDIENSDDEAVRRRARTARGALLTAWETLRLAQRRTRPYPSFVGSSAAMVRVIDEAHAVAATDVPVLLVGEVGTGKELVATAIHAWSKRRDRPFGVVSLAAVPAPLAAPRLRRAAEACAGGTLLVNDVLTGPASVDDDLAALARADLHVLGSARPSQLTAAAPSARLRWHVLRIPSLRERDHDVVEIAEHMVREDGRTLSDDAKAALLARDWPGNVRQLQQVIRAAMLRSNARTITAEDLPESPYLRFPPDRPPAPSRKRRARK